MIRTKETQDEKDYRRSVAAVFGADNRIDEGHDA
jgi:hypothetical protein